MQKRVIEVSPSSFCVSQTGAEIKKRLLSMSLQCFSLVSSRLRFSMSSCGSYSLEHFRPSRKPKSGFCRCPSSAFARNQSPTLFYLSSFESQPLERFRSLQKSKYRLLSVIFQRFSWLIGFLRFSLQGEPPLMQWKAVVFIISFSILPCEG